MSHSPLSIICAVGGLWLAVAVQSVAADRRWTDGEGFPQSAADRWPLVAAHRGSMWQEPENTLRAFAWADTVGADVVEIDLRVTADGQIVVIHDRRIDRTTDGHGAVHLKTLAELRALDAGRGYPIPTFDETLTFAAVSGVRLLLDIKDTERIDLTNLVASVKAHGAQRQMIFGIRRTEQLQTLNDDEVDLETLAFAPSKGSIPRFLDAGADAIRLWPGWIRSRPELVEQIQSRGAAVWVTTGPMEGEQLISVIALGVDGLITDHPQSALEKKFTRLVARP